MSEITEEYLSEYITLEDLIASEFKVTKKIILVNSSLYTNEAFDYVLERADENESIVFITDQRQLYTHGGWYGGDVFEENLKSFTKILVSDSEENIKGSLLAETANETLDFRGEGGIDLSAEYDILHDKNIVRINYNLNSAVNESAIVELSEDIKLTLRVEDNKIVLKKYDGANVEFENTRILEYDSGTTFIGVKVKIKDPSKLTSIRAYADNNVRASYDASSMSVNAVIPANTDTTLYLDYVYDGISGSTSIKQLWGYGWCYGISEIDSTIFDSAIKNIEKEFKEKTIKISQPVGEYGWIAYPKSTELIFTDADTGIAGGWKKIGTFIKYSKNIEYQTYRTVNAGLGTVNWRITKKQI